MFGRPRYNEKKKELHANPIEVTRLMSKFENSDLQLTVYIKEAISLMLLKLKYISSSLLEQ